jgi:hypothetical protein
MHSNFTGRDLMKMIRSSSRTEPGGAERGGQDKRFFWMTDDGAAEKSRRLKDEAKGPVFAKWPVNGQEV